MRVSGGGGWCGASGSRRQAEVGKACNVKVEFPLCDGCSWLFLGRVQELVVGFKRRRQAAQRVYYGYTMGMEMAAQMRRRRRLCDERERGNRRERVKRQSKAVSLSHPCWIPRYGRGRVPCLRQAVLMRHLTRSACTSYSTGLR